MESHFNSIGKLLMSTNNNDTSKKLFFTYLLCSRKLIWFILIFWRVIVDFVLTTMLRFYNTFLQPRVSVATRFFLTLIQPENHQNKQTNKQKQNKRPHGQRYGSRWSSPQMCLDSKHFYRKKCVSSLVLFI